MRSFEAGGGTKGAGLESLSEQVGNRCYVEKMLNNTRFTHISISQSIWKLTICAYKWEYEWNILQESHGTTLFGEYFHPCKDSQCEAWLMILHWFNRPFLHNIMSHSLNCCKQNASISCSVAASPCFTFTQSLWELPWTNTVLCSCRPAAREQLEVRCLCSRAPWLDWTWPFLFCFCFVFVFLFLWNESGLGIHPSHESQISQIKIWYWWADAFQRRLARVRNQKSEQTS